MGWDGRIRDCCRGRVDRTVRSRTVMLVHSQSRRVALMEISSHNYIPTPQLVSGKLDGSSTQSLHFIYKILERRYLFNLPK
jgi:hypothetical protein